MRGVGRVFFSLAALAVVASAEPLPETTRQFLARLAAAPYVEASSGEITVRVRSAPILCADMLYALRNRTALDEAQAAALDSVIQVRLTGRGWLLGHDLAPGTHDLGFANLAGDVRIVRDGHDVHSLWIESPGDRLPLVTATPARGGAVDVRFVVGGIEFGLEFVSRAVHDAILGTVRTVRTGRLTVHSDLRDEAFLGALAQEGDRALDVHARLLADRDFEGDVHAYVIANPKTYKALNTLVMGGEFKDRWGVTPNVNRCAYARYLPVFRPGEGGERPPVLLRSLLLHELHHVVAARLYPRMHTMWPVWIQEGLADRGAFEALEARAPEDAASFARVRRGWFDHGERVGRAPRLEDLMAGSVDVGVGPFYGACFLASGRLVQDRAWLRGLLRRMHATARRSVSHALARSETRKRFGDIRDGLSRTPPAPAVVSGQADFAGDTVRVMSEPDDAARVVWLESIPNDSVTLETAFRWGEPGQNQADVYLGYSEGVKALQFLKVAIMPQQVRLFRMREGSWSTIGTVDYETAFAVEAWHDVRIAYRAAERRVRVDLPNGRWATFDVDDYVPMAGTWYGVGTFDGVTHFKKPRVR